jgi:hypothetical protein
MATERYGYGWSDPRGLFGQDRAVVTYEIRREYDRWTWADTYSVVRVIRTTTEPYTKEPLYTGLSEETAKGYVKLLTQPED